MNDNDVIDDILKNAVRCFAVNARQSVAGLDGVFVKSVAKNKFDVSFVVTVNGKIRTVTVNFD